MSEPTIERATVTVGVAHLALALLTVIDRAGYGGRPEGVLGTAAEHPAWAPIHLAIGLLVLASVATQKRRTPALCLSFGALGCWSTFMWLWAIRLEPDATWAVAFLGFALAGVSFALSGLWADREV